MFNVLQWLPALVVAAAMLMNQADSVDALLERGDRERLQGQYTAALETHMLARERAEQAGDRARLASAWNGLGVTYRLQSDYARALDALGRGLAIREELGDRSATAGSLNNIGAVYRLQGRLTDAVATYRRALTLLDDSDRARRAVALNNLGVAHVALGDYEEALGFYRQSLELHEITGNTGGVAGTLANIGIVHRSLGNHAEALRHYERGLALARQVGDRRLVVDALKTIGVLHSAQGNTAVAMGMYRQALALYQELGVATEVALMQNNIGSLHARLGEHDLAEASLRNALRLREQIGDRVGIAESLQSLAGLARRRGNLDAAERGYEDSLRRYEAIGDQRGIAVTLAGLQEVLSQRGLHRRAVEVGERAVDVSRAMGARDQLWQALTATGRAYMAVEDDRRARDAFTEAIATIEALRLDVAGGESDQQRAFERRLAPYHSLLALAVKEGADAEAFRLAEQAKARVVLDILRAGRVNVTSAMSEADQAQEREANRVLLALAAQAGAERRRPRPDPNRLAALDRDIAQARLAREDLETRLYAAHPDLRGQRHEVEPVTVGRAADVLPDAGTAALEYVVTERDVWLFVVTRSNASGSSADSLTVRRLAIEPSQLIEDVDRLARQLASRDLQFRSTADKLYQALLGPAEAQLTDRSTLIIVPDDVLWRVPFHALWKSRTSQYVVETQAVAYAPSLTVLAEMKRRSAERANVGHAPSAGAEGLPTLLAFGNPESSALGVPGSRGQGRGVPLPRLPSAEAEVATLGRLYGAANSRVYVGGEASEDRLKAEAGRYSVLHLATHGILDDASPMYSHLLLAPSRRTAGEDGELQAWEIARLQLGARLVVLSGCETARGRVAPGEGVIGLTWALFVAGASTTVVSQWAVDSASTSELMVNFHRLLQGRPAARSPGAAAAGKVSPARALQQAALPLLRASRSRHPFYWAAFVVIGDGF